MTETKVLKKRVKQQPLQRNVPKKKARALYAACDLETGLLANGARGLGGEFLDACVVCEDRPGKYYHFSGPGKLLEFFARNPQYEYYFHNGSGYDFSYFIPALFKLIDRHKADVSLCKQGKSRIIGMTIKFKNYGKSKQVIVKDSLPLLNMSLDKATSFFAPELPKLSGTIDWEHEVYDKHNVEHIQYLHRDCDGLLAVLIRFASLMDETFGVAPGWTAGSTAIKAWKAHIPENEVYYRNHREVEMFVREGYYGGYVFPGQDRQVNPDVKSIDFNAHFAGIMRKGVAIGAPSHDVEFQPDRRGMWRVICTVPQNDPFPVIPSRDEHGMLQWLGPGSVFTTTVTTDEINYAKTKGYQFEVLEGYWYYREAFPFQEFLSLCEGLELTIGGALKELAKLLRNALYGKFGSSLFNESLELRYDCPSDAGYRPLIDEETGREVAGVVEHAEENDSNYIMPMWAAEITAGARLKLFAVMDAVGAEHVRYCDTDSVKADAEAIDRIIEEGIVVVKPGYGNVKVDDEYDWFQALGTKNYRAKLSARVYAEACAKNPKASRYVGKVKGIPKQALTILHHFLAAHDQDSIVEFNSVNNVLARIKNPDIPISQVRHRKLGGLDHSASWQIDKDGRIHAVVRVMSEAEKQREREKPLWNAIKHKIPIL